MPEEANLEGLKGPVNAVLTEDFRYESGVSEPTGTRYEIYDRRGYQLEVFLYKPDGSLCVHTIITRNGDQIFRSQTIGTPPFESYSEENIFDAEGRAIETDVYDGKGILKRKTTLRFEERGNSTVTRWTETAGDGTENTGEDIDTVGPEVGVTRQVSTRNGELKSNWVIQQEAGGVLPKDKLVLPDGSYDEREQSADGSIADDRY